MVILMQAPILVDVLRAVLPEYRISRLTSQATNFLLIFLVSFLFLVALGYHLFVFLPYLANDPYPLTTLKGIGHVLFAGWVWTNMVVNYYLAVFTHPGTEPEPQTESANGEAVIGGDQNLETPSGEGGIVKPATAEETLKRRAVTVGVADARPQEPQNTPPKEEEIPKNGMEWKPKRSHFCKLCNVRVPYMDHHCPFTGNCVGYGNFSYFYLWLLYMTLGLGYAIWVVFPYFSQCMLTKVWAYLGLWDGPKNELCLSLGDHSSIVIPIIGGFWVCWNMFWLQTFLLLVDLSTYNVLTKFMKVSMLRFMWHRVKGRKFMEPGSRLNMLMLKRRPNMLWFLVPVIFDSCSCYTCTGDPRSVQ